LARRARLRRWASAGLAGVASFVAVSAVSPTRPAPTGVPTLTVVRALPAGATIEQTDLAVVDRPADDRPETALSALEQAVGHTTATAIAARDVLTPERLVGADLLAAQPEGRVAMGVPVLDAASSGARAGSHVDLYATGTGELTAEDVVVLAIQTATPGSSAWSSDAAARVTLALDTSTASRVARALSALEAGESFVLAVRRTG
jgi:Flp pilus assembly protein CpaB